MGFIVLWIIMGVVVAMIAHSKGKSAPLWFIYGAVIWPIALVHALLIKAETGTMHAASPRSLSTPPGHLLSEDRVCPFCAETVKKAAKICRFCQRDLPPLPAADPPLWQ